MAEGAIEGGPAEERAQQCEERCGGTCVDNERSEENSPIVNSGKLCIRRFSTPLDRDRKRRIEQESLPDQIQAAGSC